jgi:hypothetical protein
VFSTVALVILPCRSGGFFIPRLAYELLELATSNLVISELAGEDICVPYILNENVIFKESKIEINI